MRPRPLAPWVVCLACFDVTSVILGILVPHHWWFWLEGAAPNVVLLAVALRRRARAARRRDELELEREHDRHRDKLALEREYDRLAAPVGAGRNGRRSSTRKSARRR